MPSPLVSVVIPAYNAQATIGRALDSVAAQDYAPIEVIVVDDGSKDETADVVENYRRLDVRLYKLPENGGTAEASNTGIAHARGDYVAFLDADDEWLPTKLTRQIEALERNPRAVLASCGCIFVDQLGRGYRDFGRPPPGYAKDRVWRLLLAETCLAKPCVVVRAAALKQVGAFDSRLPVAEDQDMWIRLAMNGEVEFIDEFLVHAYDTPNSLTKVYANRTADYLLPVVRRHIRAMRSHLGAGEIRRTLARRYTSIGRNLYSTGSLFRGAYYIAAAIMGGHRVRENLWYLITASPPARWLKRYIRPAAAPISAPGVRPAAQDDGGLLRPAAADLVAFPSGPPVLTVVVDAEAEFNWNGPFSRDLTNVVNLGRQEPAQRLFDRHGIRPAYMVAYAVATQAGGYGPLKEFLQSGRCEIGAHLQPWENPPLAEEPSERNSYLSNLPAWLQKEKLQRLTEAIETGFGVRPVSHKAGRYGVGVATGRILAALDYQIDLSVLPATDLTPRHGPYFSDSPAQPYWFGPDRGLLELPMTVALVGRASAAGRFLLPALSNPALRSLRLPGLLARAGLLDRITLTPEGITGSEMRYLTRALLARGHRFFTLSYHSSSLLPGSTPYVGSERDLAAFLERIEGFLDFFFGELGGCAMTPLEVRALALAARRAPDKDAPLAAATPSAAQ